MVNPLDFAGRRFLVTGASSGIGRETAILISRLGGRLVVSGRNSDRLEATLRALDGAGHSAELFDLDEVSAIPTWLKNLAVSGHFHGFAHCAGIHFMTPLRVVEPSMLDKMMRINFQSAVMLARGMRQRSCIAPDGGSIVFVSSVAAFAGEAGVLAYSASKAALLGLTRSLAMELASERIRVNAVAPGFVKSEMSDQILASLPPEHAAAITKKYPLGVGDVADVANSIVFLLADTGRWITGSTLVVDGGYSAH